MTLVVAKKNGRFLALVSDTGVTRHGQRLPYDNQIPKIAIVDANVAVAFAGDPDLAISAISQTPSDHSYRTIVDYFLSRHRESEEAVDFLLAFKEPVVKSVAIRAKAVKQDRSWIGDKDAFEDYQAFRMQRNPARVNPAFEAVHVIMDGSRGPLDNNPVLGMTDYMRRVTLDPKVDSVFGQVVAVDNGGGSFDFRPYSIMLNHYADIEPASPGAFAEVNEMRNFALSCIVSAPGRPASNRFSL